MTPSFLACTEGDMASSQISIWRGQGGEGFGSEGKLCLSIVQFKHFLGHPMMNIGDECLELAWGILSGKVTWLVA